MAEVKLKDIAQAAGVSTVTVSNALSGKRGVSIDVREKIEKIARNMGYDFSRYEKKEGGYRIGVIASEMYMEMGTSFYWAMYQQIVYAASKSQSQTMLEILDTDMQRRDELPKLMREKMIDGLIIIGWHFKSYVENLVKKSEIPISEISDLFPDGFHFTNFHLRIFFTVQAEDSLSATIVEQPGSNIFSII